MTRKLYLLCKKSPGDSVASSFLKKFSGIQVCICQLGKLGFLECGDFSFKADSLKNGGFS